MDETREARDVARALKEQARRPDPCTLRVGDIVAGIDNGAVGWKDRVGLRGVVCRDDPRNGFPVVAWWDGRFTCATTGGFELVVRNPNPPAWRSDDPLVSMAESLAKMAETNGEILNLLRSGTVAVHDEAAFARLGNLENTLESINHHVFNLR